MSRNWRQMVDRRILLCNYCKKFQVKLKKMKGYRFIRPRLQKIEYPLQSERFCARGRAHSGIWATRPKAASVAKGCVHSRRDGRGARTKGAAGTKEMSAVRQGRSIVSVWSELCAFVRLCPHTGGADWSVYRMVYRLFSDYFGIFRLFSPFGGGRGMGVCECRVRDAGFNAQLYLQCQSRNLCKRLFWLRTECEIR